jgi:hypothetical protein
MGRCRALPRQVSFLNSTVKKAVFLLGKFVKNHTPKCIPVLCPTFQPEGRVLVMELEELSRYLGSKKTPSESGRLVSSIPVPSLRGTVGVGIEKP